MKHKIVLGSTRFCVVLTQFVLMVAQTCVQEIFGFQVEKATGLRLVFCLEKSP